MKKLRFLKRSFPVFIEELKSGKVVKL